jgi:catechol 2,3-dioxygenase-like lactoylglutathione lyase family enzyme
MTILGSFASLAIVCAAAIAVARDDGLGYARGGLRSSEAQASVTHPSAQDGKAFTIKSVDHTGFTVASLEASLPFWVDVLGFKHLYTWTFETEPFIEEVVGVPGAAVRLAMVEGPGHRIELLEYTAPNDRQIYKPRSSDVGAVHLAFYVENIDALLARAASAGWLPVGKVQTVASGERQGLRLVYIRGPDGVTIELMQRPKDAQNWRRQQRVGALD